MTKELKTIEELKQRLTTINFEARQFSKKYETTLSVQSREARTAYTSLASIQSGYQLASEKISSSERLSGRDFFDQIEKCLPNDALDKEKINLETYMTSLAVNDAFRMRLGPLLDKLRIKIQTIDNDFQRDKSVVEEHLTASLVTVSPKALEKHEVAAKKTFVQSVSSITSQARHYLNRGKQANDERVLASELAKEEASNAHTIMIEPYLAYVDRHRNEIKGHEEIMEQMVLLNTSESRIKDSICNGLRETYQERQAQFDDDSKELQTSAQGKVIHEQTLKTLKGMRPIDVSHINNKDVLIDALNRQASQVETLTELNKQYVNDDFVWQKTHLIIESPTLLQGVLTANIDSNVVQSILSCAKKYEISSTFVEDAVNALQIDTLNQAAVDGVLAFIKHGGGKDGNYSKVEPKLEFMSIVLAKQDVDERKKIIKAINKPNVVKAVISLSQLNLPSQINFEIVGKHADKINFLSANASARNDVDEILSTKGKPGAIAVLMLALKNGLVMEPDMIKRFVSNVANGNDAKIIEDQEKLVAMTQVNVSKLDKAVKQEAMRVIEGNVTLSQAINHISEPNSSSKMGDESLLLALINEVVLSDADKSMASKICDTNNGEDYQNALVTLQQHYLNIGDDVLTSPLIQTLNQMPIDKMKQTADMLNALNDAFEQAVELDKDNPTFRKNLVQVKYDSCKVVLDTSIGEGEKYAQISKVINRSLTPSFAQKISRIVKDVFMAAGCLVGVGVAVGLYRQSKGQSFWHQSKDKPQQAADDIKKTLSSVKSEDDENKENTSHNALN